MIKKFIDESENTYVFIEAEGKLIMWLNGKSEYTLTEIAGFPETLEDVYQLCRLNIWYPMEQI